VKIELEGVRHVYSARGERRTALSVARLEVESGGRLCLVGSSGSGKTTLLNILAGVLVPSAGRVLLAGTDVTRLREVERDALRSRSIGCVFQTFNLLQGLSALENLTLAQRFAGIGRASAERRARELLEQLGLGARAQARPAELSVGEQQRVAIARAVSKRPGLVLADEPTASLDDENADAAIALLLETSQDCTLVVATHDARVIGRFAAVRSLADLAGAAR
jgi:putative ABC transport system ATP-binding protein